MRAFTTSLLISQREGKLSVADFRLGYSEAKRRLWNALLHQEGVLTQVHSAGIQFRLQQELRRLTCSTRRVTNASMVWVTPKGGCSSPSSKNLTSVLRCKESARCFRSFLPKNPLKTIKTRSPVTSTLTRNWLLLCAKRAFS